jgi:hypothetical protein
MAIRPPFGEKSRDGTLDLVGITCVDRSYLHTKHLRCAPHGAERGKRGRIGGIAEHGDPRNARCNLPEKFKHLPAKTEFIKHEAGRVTAWVRQGLDEAGTDRIADCREHDR